MEFLEEFGAEYSNYFHQADISKEVIHGTPLQKFWFFIRSVLDKSGMYEHR